MSVKPASVINTTAFGDVFRDCLVSFLSVPDLINLYNTCKHLRHLVVRSRNWEALYEEYFGHDDVQIPGTPFERYCKRYTATIYTWIPRGVSIPQEYSLPTESPVKDVAASRIALAVLATDGELYGIWLNEKFSTVREKRLRTKESSKFTRVWAGMDLIHALDAEGRVYVWHSLDPLGVRLPLELGDLGSNLILARSGKRLHTLLVKGLGIVWWTEWLFWPYVDYRVVPGTDPERQDSPWRVKDIVVLRRGIVFLTDSDANQVYWVPLLDDSGRPLSIEMLNPVPIEGFQNNLKLGSRYVKLRLYDFYKGSFVAISDQHELVKGMVSHNNSLLTKNISSKKGDHNLIDVASFYRQHLALTDSGRILLWGTRGNSMADMRRAPNRHLFGNSRNQIFHMMERVKDYFQYKVGRAIPLPVDPSLRIVNGISISAALVLGESP